MLTVPNAVSVCTHRMLKADYAELRVTLMQSLVKQARLSPKDRLEFILEGTTLKLRYTPEKIENSSQIRKGSSLSIGITEKHLSSAGVLLEYSTTRLDAELDGEWLCIDLPEDMFRQQKGFDLVKGEQKGFAAISGSDVLPLFCTGTR